MTPETPQPTGSPIPPPPPPAPPDQARPAPAPHERLLRSVRARQTRRLWTEGALYGIAAAVGLVALSGFAGKLGPDLGKAALFLAPLAFAGSLVFFGVFRKRREVGDEWRTARLLADRAPDLSRDVLTAVELKRALRGQPDFSVDLARAFLAGADRRADGMDGSALVDRGPVRRASYVLAGICAAAFLVVAIWPKAWLSGQQRIFPSGAAPTEEAREPITGDVELTYHYPAYTGLSSRTVAGTAGEIQAPRGTEVQIKTRADRDVARAELVVNGQSLPLQVTGTRELAGRFVLDKSGSYHFAFLSPRGRVVAQGPDVSIDAQADSPPKVTLLLPQEELEVDPGQKVVLKFDATDDYGLTSLALVYKTPGGQEERVALPHDEGRRSQGQYTWDIGGLKIRPGDRVSYYIEAQDNDEVDGHQKGVSRTQVLKLYSADEHRQAALRKAELLWERLVTQLANRLEGPDRARELDPVKVAAQAPVDEAGNALATDLSQASRELAQERDSPPELWTALANISESYGRKVRVTQESRRIFVRLQKHGAFFDPGRRLTRAVEDEIAETEKDVLYLETLIDRQKLEELKDLAQQLNAERRELSSLIERYKQSKDEKLKAEILKDVDALKAHINELMQRMAELAKGIRDEHLNAEAIDQLMKEKDLNSALDDVEKLLREGKTDEALAKLQELSMQMEEMLSKLENADQQLGQEEYPELAQKFQGFMNQLRQTTAEQKKVAEQTKEIRDRYKNKMKERLQEKGRALKEPLLKEIEEVQKDYQQLGSDQLNAMRAQQDLEHAKGEVDNLKSALKVEDYDLAAEAAARAERAAAELFGDAQQQKSLDEMYQNPPEVRAQSKKMAERMGKDADKLHDVSQKLQQLFPQPGQMMSEEDRQRLKSLGGQQQQLEQKARGLQQQMSEMQQMAPVFDPDAEQQMNEIGDRMGEATQKLQSKDPNRGYGEQRAALEGLQQFEQQMQESQKRQGGKGGLPLPMFAGRQEGPGGSSHEKVEIPDPDQYQAPKEFRKDLLDAMKQGAPEKYKDQVKQYYEELVK